VDEHEQMAGSLARGLADAEAGRTRRLDWLTEDIEDAEDADPPFG
jgi:hypothetical protein